VTSSQHITQRKDNTSTFYLKQFLGDSFLLFISNGIISTLNYVFILAAGRTLSKAAFGTFATLLACITISTVLLNSFQLHVIRRVVILRKAWAEYVGNLSNRVGYHCLLLGCLFLSTAPIAAELLGTTWVEWLITYACISAFLLSTLANGVSAGLLRFQVQAVANLLGTCTKLLVGVLLLWAGLGVSGALLGYAVGLGLVYVITLVLLENPFFVPSGYRDRPNSVSGDIAESEGSGKRFGPAFIFAYLALVGPFSLDQILVQSIARPLSGEYGVVCVFSKAVFFAVGPILSVQFAHVGASFDSNRSRNIFVGSVSITVSLVVLLAGGLWVFGDMLVPLLFSPQYAHTATLIAPMAIGVSAYVIGHAVGLVLLARNAIRSLLLVGAVFPIQLALFASRNTTLPMLVTNQLFVYGAQLILIILAALFAHRVRTIEPLAPGTGG
jgi:O-antigen/teichoic acid export membrane protein